jgi:hypothetical protein
MIRCNILILPHVLLVIRKFIGLTTAFNLLLCVRNYYFSKVCHQPERGESMIR